MKRIYLFIVLQSFVFGLAAQDITDAVRYGNVNIHGSARFHALGGAFGALGGDLSAVSANPAGSAIFSKSYFSATLGVKSFENNTDYFGTSTTNSDGNIGF